MREGLKAVAERWMEEVWRRRDLDAIHEMHAPGYRDRSLPNQPGPEPYKAEVAALFAAFPDFRAAAEDIIVDESAGKVVVLWTGAGTHEGEFMGVAPTGGRIEFEGIEALRIEDGLIAERWGEWDGVSILKQLGKIE